MQFKFRRIDWDALWPLLFVGYIAGIIAIVLPLPETVLLAIGVGGLTGSLMRYCRKRHGTDV